MNKATITLKVDDYTIILHRGEEELKEIINRQLKLKKSDNEIEKLNFAFN